MPAEERPGARDGRGPRAKSTAAPKAGSQVFSWLWAILAFVLFEGTIAQARMIPSGSMENTILVGDHLLVDRLGYSAGIPFTDAQIPLWVHPRRQQIVVFAPPPAEGSNQDLIKRVIGVPGDLIRIRDGKVYVNGNVLAEPYVLPDPEDGTSAFENFPPAGPVPPDLSLAPGWAARLEDYVTGGQLRVPPDCYFVMGDNRGNSYDSRYWGFVPRQSIIGEPLFIYLSIRAPGSAWETGHVGQRLRAYLSVLIRPQSMRWNRLFRTF